MTERRGDWIQTFTGGQFWPLDPRPEDFDLVDIAHALSHQCRFSGHCSYFYSVAEHSMIVADLCPSRCRKEALLHDASEAYLIDVPRPIKPFLVGYKEMEQGINDALAKRFGIDEVWPAEVKRADNMALGLELQEIMAKPPVTWHWDMPPLSAAEARKVTTRCLDPKDAFEEFYAALKEACHG